MSEKLVSLQHMVVIYKYAKFNGDGPFGCLQLLYMPKILTVIKMLTCLKIIIAWSC